MRIYQVRQRNFESLNRKGNFGMESLIIDIIGILGMIIVSIMFMHYFILAWLFPKRIIEIQIRLMQRYQKWFPFIPNWILDLILLTKHEKMYLWFFRVIATLGATMVVIISLAIIF
jgi:hypothetical protein